VERGRERGRWGRPPLPPLRGTLSPEGERVMS
jgi:hypothetical protein